MSNASPTSSAFFYGTLLRPDIVKHVLNNDATHLKAAPAILLNHTRVRIVDRDYPAVVPSDKAEASLFKAALTPEQRSVQGILVTGITAEDLKFLDEFEADEYERVVLPVIPLAAEGSLDELVVSPDSSQLPQGTEKSVSANVYVWVQSYSGLEARAWSYEEFVREKMWRWVNPEVHYYTNALSVEFGHPMKKHFGMDDTYVNVNHGSFGTVPLRVIEYSEKLGRECDARPDYWFRIGAEPRITDVRKKLAHFLNADVDECVLVTNATAGVNHVMRNFEWNAGDVLVSASSTYGAVSLTLKYTHDVRPHPDLSTMTFTFPMTHDEIVDTFRSHLRGIPRKEGQKVLAVIDAIVSVPGVVLPWERMVQVCKEENVWSLVDAAHAIGHIPVDLASADPDFWVSNCHKWLYARRGCAVFYVPKRNQHIMKTAFPTSWAYKSPDEVKPGENLFVEQFGACGTMDLVPYMTVAAALEFRKDIGGEKAISSYCHFLALHAARRMAEVWGTRVMDEDGSLTANMFNVQMPLPVHAKSTRDDLTARANDFKNRMLVEYNAPVQVSVQGKHWWFRGSAQIFNELSDYEYAAKHLKTLCDEFIAADEKKYGD